MTTLYVIASVTILALAWFWARRLGSDPDMFGYKIAYAAIVIVAATVVVGGFWIGYLTRGCATQ